MWIQKRIEISWYHLMKTLFFPSFILSRSQLIHKISSFFQKRNPFICFSVRTGFHLLFSVLNFPDDSEIIVTAINIPHMFQIMKSHHLKIIPVDIDLDTLEPNTDLIQKKISSKTKAIVVAHLFGTKINIKPIQDLCHLQNLILIEDSAQYFYRPDDDFESDIKMHSFGTIKTKTCLGGAIFLIKDGVLFEKMKRKYSSYEKQTEWEYKVKILKSIAMKFFSLKAIFSLICKISALFNIPIDKMMYGWTKSFKGGNFFQKISKQPSKQLLQLMYTRLNRFSNLDIDKHIEQCIWITSVLRKKYLIPGTLAKKNMYWVYPILSQDLLKNISFFRKENFFLSNQHGIGTYDPDDPELIHSKFLMDNIIYLPFYPAMPLFEKERLIHLLERSQTPFQKRCLEPQSPCQKDAVLLK